METVNVAQGSKLPGAALFQIGYLLVHLGCISKDEMGKTARNHLVALGLATISFFFMGYILAYGKDWYGVMGVSHWLLSSDSRTDLAIHGWSVVCATGSIIQLAMSDKVSLLANLIAVVFNSTIMIPLILHWGLSDGWMSWIMEGFGFVDPYGVITVNVYAGSFTVGILLFKKSKRKEGSSQIITLLGYFCVIIGVIEMTSPLSNAKIVADLTAISVGLVATLMIGAIFKGRKLAILLVQGALSSLLMIAPVQGMTILHSLFAGIMTSITTIGLLRAIEGAKFDDFSGVIPLHLTTGIWSSFLIGTQTGTHSVSHSFTQVGIQSFCTFFIFLLGLLASAMVRLLDSILIFTVGASQVKVPTPDSPRPLKMFKEPTSHKNDIISKKYQDVEIPGEGNSNLWQSDTSNILIYYKQWGQDTHRVLTVQNPEKIVTVIPRRKQDE